MSRAAKVGLHDDGEAGAALFVATGITGRAKTVNVTTHR